MTSIKIDAFCPVGIGGTKGIDTTHLKLFVGGLLPTHTSKDLYDIFAPFGTIRESVVIPDRFRVRSRCYGFVTFAEHESVSEVFRKSPITTSNGAKLTVVLASANTKPRRAHFNVKHGTSGHKPLPMVKEEEEEFQRDAAPKDSIMVRTKTIKRNKYNKPKTGEESKIGIYTDPSLFRTANIQPIAPASFYVKSKKKTEIDNGSWPNEDIKKDFYNLKKIAVSKDNQSRKERKSWKLVAVEQEMDNDSYYGYDNLSEYDQDEFYSVNSRKWTPLSDKRSCAGDSLSNSMVNPSSSQDYRYHDRDDEKVSKPQKKRCRTRRGKGGNKGKWVKSPQKKESKLAAMCKSEETSVCDDETTDNERGDELEIDEEDRLTFASLFDGSYQNLLFEQETMSMGYNYNQYQMQSAHSVVHKKESNEMEQLRNIFKNRMNSKITGKRGGDIQQQQQQQQHKQPMFKQNQNGTWSPYQTMFNAVSSGNYGQSQSVNGLYQHIIPTPPIQPINVAMNTAYHSDSGSVQSTTNQAVHAAVNGVYGGYTANTVNTAMNVGDNNTNTNNTNNNNGLSQTASSHHVPLCNYAQTNVVCNTNYFYNSNGSLHSLSNGK